MSDNEIWKPVKDYEGLYEVSNLGRVKSLKFPKHKIMKHTINGIGYTTVRLTKNNYSVNVASHRIIATAFIDNPLNKPNINHINAIRTDNRIENLEWATSKENFEHALMLGNVNPLCEKNCNTKITNEIALDIYNSQESKKYLCKKYNVSIDVVNNIKAGRSWSTITNHKKPISRG